VGGGGGGELTDILTVKQRCSPMMLA
jgi:hypothetical protein